MYYVYIVSISIYIYFACLGVCYYPKKVKTAEPIGLKFCVGPHMTPEKKILAQNQKLK